MTSHKGPRGGGAATRFAAALAVVAAGMTGCTDAAGYDLDYLMGRIAVLSTMRAPAAYKAQQMPRLPAPGSVPLAGPVGELLPAFDHTQLDSAAATLINPLPATAEVLARGESVYRNQCAVCHGAQGEGNGPVVGAGRFPFGPELLGGAAAGRSDGYIYAIVRAGRGLMPSYGDRVGHNDRWALVHYLRQLQGQTMTPATAPQAVSPAVPAAETAPPDAQPPPPVEAGQ